jgi:mannose-6-phosphate isomerase-like protein (cupin superfamily)
MQVIDGAGRFTRPAEGDGTHWTEQLRVPDLSVGTYSIQAGAADGQQPHTEDEIYVVTAGQATFEAGPDHVHVGPGTVLYVPAGEPHRFTAITQDLAVIVVFAPAEDSRAAAVGAQLGSARS